MPDLPEKTTHAQRRRMEAKMGARLKLKAGQFVRRLKEIAEKAESVEPSMVPALRLKADIYIRLLGKCLPDLKAIEHSGEITNTHVTELSDEEIDARLERLEAERVRAADGDAQKASGQKKSPGVH